MGVLAKYLWKRNFKFYPHVSGFSVETFNFVSTLKLFCDENLNSGQTDF